MRAAAVGDHRDPGHAWQERVSRPANVVFVGVGMILVQLAYRAWAVQGGWFLIDDYGFLANGVGRDLSWHYLFTPYGDHQQPLGFLIVWAVSQSTPYDWFLASTITMAFQALASAACLVFLLRLCGRRWSVLVPLAFYLFSVVTLPGFMWWAAAIRQVPLQLFAFLAMTAHLEYVRTRRLRYAALAAVALSLGMLCDVKILFAGLCFVFLSLYLSDGHGPRGRLRDGLLGQWRAWLLYAVMLAGYLMGYLRLNPVADRGVEAPGAIFETMLRYAMGPVLLGGPWKWGPSGDAPLPPPGPPMGSDDHVGRHRAAESSRRPSDDSVRRRGRSCCSWWPSGATS